MENKSKPREVLILPSELTDAGAGISINLLPAREDLRLQVVHHFDDRRFEFGHFFARAD